MSKIVYWLIICSTFLLLSGCDRQVKQNGAYSRVSGQYEGRKNLMREVINLSATGTFEHEVFKGNAVILSESGSYTVEERTIELRPFTRFFDPKSGEFKETGSPFVVDYYYLISGPTYISITPWPDQPYELVKTNKAPVQGITM